MRETTRSIPWYDRPIPFARILGYLLIVLGLLALPVFGIVPAAGAWFFAILLLLLAKF